MKDYQETPQKASVDYSLFLIRQVKIFNAKILDTICQEVFAEGEIVSLERLFRGHQTALTIFGPKSILNKFQNELNLLELEDYTGEFTDSKIYVWEVGAKKTTKLNLDHFSNFFRNLPKLKSDEHFYWQLLLSRDQIQIRAAVSSNDPIRKKLLHSVQDLNTGGLVKIPNPFSNEQMIKFYKTRSVNKNDFGPILDSKEIISLLKV